MKVITGGSIHKTLWWLVLASVVLPLLLACGLTVTPPDDYPPPQDLQEPAPPCDVRVSVNVDQNFRPAVQIDWQASYDPDVLLYRLYRSAAQEDRDLAVRLAGTMTCFDPAVVFPSIEGDLQYYRYTLRAVDSSGNFSAYSDSASVTLAVPPVLATPLGRVASNDPSLLTFTWMSQYTIGKDFFIHVVNNNGDTLLAVHLPRYSYDQTSYSETYNALKALSSLNAPLLLAPGEYHWWVRMVLVDLGTANERPAAVAAGTFIIE